MPIILSHHKTDTRTMFMDYLLLGLILFVTSSVTQYVIKIRHNNLEQILIGRNLRSNLDLSHSNLSAVNEEAFANLNHLKTLNLSMNRLEELPVLANLSRLERLDLANNDIKSGKFYVGLSSLKILNLSNNNLTYFEPGHFFGLTKSATILTHGLNLSSMSSAMFIDPVTVRNFQPFSMNDQKYGFGEDNDSKPSNQDNNIEIKVCIQDGHLTSVENLKNGTSLQEECRKINSSSGTLKLNDMGIRTFERGWYRLHDPYITSIVLSDNEIVKFTKELLNDLPAEITRVCLSRNKIEKIKKGTIENRNNINVLDLRDNLISKIEAGALEKLELRQWLLLGKNRLKNTKFLDSLPPNVKFVSLNHNSITEISIGNFAKFSQFRHLNLAYNNITKIKANTLTNFPSLETLSLRMNNLQNIEPGAFQDLKNLRNLHLSNNKISSLETDIFLGLDNVKHISLNANVINEFLINLLIKMPPSLEILRLGSNKIQSGNTGMLLLIRPHGLSWQRKKISFPNLKVLDLHDNSLMHVEGISTKGLANLAVLSLAANGITTIEEGSIRELSNLQVLDLSRNPIKYLTNGALFGLPKDSQTIIRVDRVPLELIQGGVFDEV